MEASKQKDDVSIGNENNRRELGLLIYANSATFSDITIRYGHEGELTFQAHKLLLSANSYWFQAAFQGGFQESSAKEIRLRDDDPAAISAMLDSVYRSGRINFPELDASATHVIFCIELYRVADKYDVPNLFMQIRSSFYHRVAEWLDAETPDNGNKAKEAVSPESFSEVISKLYGLPNIKIGHPLVDVLLDQLEIREATKICQNGGVVSPLLEQACEKVPEFGRDLCLHLLRMGSMGEIGLMTQVKCPECEGVWRRSDSDTPFGYCHLCGLHAEDWV